MKIGVPRETKDNEFRVGMTPDGARQLVADGHGPLLRTILTEFIGDSAQTCTVDEFKRHLKRRKTPYMTRLAFRVAADPQLATQMPTPFLNLIEGLRSGSL